MYKIIYLDKRTTAVRGFPEVYDDLDKARAKLSLSDAYGFIIRRSDNKVLVRNYYRSIYKLKK